MNRLFILALSGLLCSVACGPKKTTTTTASETTTQGSETANLSKFQKKLVETTIVNWEPSDGGGAQFLYTSLKFKADNSWKAAGMVKANFEEFPCTESGTWSVSSETGANGGTIEWTLKDTDCISREAGTTLRTLIEFSGGDYKISFR